MADGRLIKGQASAQQKNDVEFIPNVGMRTILRRDFFNYDQAVAHAAANFGEGIKSSVRQKGDEPIWTVETSFEGDPNDPDSDIQNTHELRVNILNPDIKANLVLQRRFTQTYGGYAKQIAAVENYANAVKNAEDPSAEYNTLISDMATTGPFVADNAALAIRLLDKLLVGSDTFIDFQYVYVHTFNVGVQRELVPDRFGEIEVFSPGGVVDAEGTPALMGLVGVGGEWLKLPVETTTMYGGRVLHKYEYWWADEWDDLTYDQSGV